MQARIKKEEYIANPAEIKSIAQQFANALKKELDGMIVSVVLFGSQVKTRFAGGKKPLLQDKILFSSDIDVLVVFDDMIHVMNPELVTAYRVVTERVAANVSRRLHITTMPITKFWDYAQKGDPIMVNMLREGEILIDKGMFGMAKSLLSAKLIKPTNETVQIYLSNAPLSIAAAKHQMKKSIMTLHWSVMDAAHAALLHKKIVPDNPEHLVKMFDHYIVQRGLMPKKYLVMLTEFQNMGNRILHGTHKHADGEQVDRYRKLAGEFYTAVNTMIKSK